jgi:hypothetical protein
MLQVLTLDQPASHLFSIVYTNGKLATICLCLCLDSLSLLLSKLVIVSSLLFVVDTLKILLNDLSIACLR